MGEALLAGLLRTGWVEPGQVTIVEPDASRRADLAAAHPGVALATEPVDADGAVVAVKPGHVIEACRALAGVRVGRVLSIAAGVATATIELALGAEVPVVRAMPNTPALVGVGASAVAPGRWASDDDLAWARDVLGAVGVVETVPESLLDAVTGLSGSGPAYVYLVAEALVDAGVLAGLPRPTAEVLAHQTADVQSRRREQALITAQALPVKLVIPLVICFLPGIFVWTLGPAFYQFLQMIEGVLRGATGGAGGLAP